MEPQTESEGIDMTLDELKELIANDEGETVEVKESIGQRHLVTPVVTPVTPPVGNLGADGSVEVIWPPAAAKFERGVDEGVIWPSVTAKLESAVHEADAA